MDDQLITDRYAIYNADCMDVMTQFPSESIHLSVYSPAVRRAVPLQQQRARPIQRP